MKTLTLNGRIAFAALFGGICWAGAGCMTFQDTQAQQAAARQREDMLIVRDDMRKLSGRIETVELELDRMRRDLEALGAAQDRTLQSRLAALETQIETLSRRITAVDAAREKDRQEIVDRLSAKIAEVVKATAPKPTRSRETRAHSGEGVEHVVQPGETLSAIASAYGVRAKAIIDQNKIPDPDRLQVGQKLFIPQ